MTLVEVELDPPASPGAQTAWSFLDPAELSIGGVASSAGIRIPGDPPGRIFAILRRVGDHYQLHAGEPGAPLPSQVQPGLPVAELTSLQLGGQSCRVRLSRVVPCGNYLINGRIGRGGMADVYAARQIGPGGFDRPVVLKLIRPDTMGHHPRGREMLLDEARIAAQILHPNVVTIHEVGEHQGLLYIVMEYLRGVTLHNLAWAARSRGLRLPPDLAAALLSQVCTGLHAAHELRRRDRPIGVVHRDVSPSNIVCLAGGQVKVIDFGIARAEGRLAEATGRFGIKGKPMYMSPEQAAGLPLDRRSDLFSAAVVLYELCTGQPLFLRATLAETLWAILHDEIPPLRERCPTAPVELSEGVHAALSRAPEQRPATALAFAEVLDRVVQQGGGSFATPQGIARYLHERGLSLQGPPPIPLGELPAALQRLGTPSPAAPRAAAVAADTPATAPPLPDERDERDGGSTAPEQGELPTVRLPPGRSVQRLSFCGRDLVLHASQVELQQLGVPLRLALCEVPDLLPGPLSLQVHAGALSLVIAGPQGSRVRLVPEGGEQRIQRCFLHAGGGPITLTHGHRSTGFRTLRCHTAQVEAAAAPPACDVPELGLRVVAPLGARQILVVHTARDADPAVYVECVSIG